MRINLNGGAKQKAREKYEEACRARDEAHRKWSQAEVDLAAVKGSGVSQTRAAVAVVENAKRAVRSADVKCRNLAREAGI